MGAFKSFLLWFLASAVVLPPALFFVLKAEDQAIIREKVFEWIELNVMSFLFPPQFTTYSVPDYPEHRMVVKTKTVPPFLIVLPDPSMDQVIPYFIKKTGQWEPHLTRLFGSLLANCSPSHLVIDAGANSGYYGLYAAALGCKVIAIEPQERLTKLVNHSVILNEFKEVDVVTAALSDYSGVAHIGIGHQRWGGAQVLEDSRVRRVPKDDVKVVPAVTLDELVPTANIFFLKIDCEGHEERILEGAKNLLSSGRVDHILLEVFPKSNLFGSLSALVEQGFVIHDSRTPTVVIPSERLKEHLETTVASYSKGHPMTELFLSRQR